MGQEKQYVIVLHGGAGTLKESSFTEDLKKQYLDVLDLALSAGKNM